MPHISQLVIYPVKSLGGIAVQSAVITSRGLQHDRRWMLVNSDNQFMSQRSNPQLALFQLELVADGFKVTYVLNQASQIIPFVPQTQDFLKVRIWNDECNATAVSDELNTWFSNILNEETRLVFMSDDSIRQVDTKYAGPGHITSFADDYPMLLIGEASLDDLNARLPEPVPMNRFRPNMVIAGTAPYMEDQMQHFTVASINFYGVKTCVRCVMITIDQQTAQSNAEPLKTMAGYRKNNKKVHFGQNLVHHGEGVLKVGDDVKILELGQALVFDS
jgi:uncharacterized protein YcbX